MRDLLIGMAVIVAMTPVSYSFILLGQIVGDALADPAAERERLERAATAKENHRG